MKDRMKSETEGHEKADELAKHPRLEDRLQEKSKVQMARAGTWEHVAAKQQEVSAFVCRKDGKQSIHEQMKGKCRDFAPLQTGLAITVNEKSKMVI